MKNYKVILFDLDDTLIDNYENIRHAFKKMLEANGHTYSDIDFSRWYDIDINFWKDWQDGRIDIPDELKHETGKKSSKYVDWVRAQRVLLYFENEIPLERAIELSNVYIEGLRENVIEINGAHEILKYLSKKYIVAIATNGPSAAATDKLEKIGCLEFVRDIFAADMFGFMKPSIEFFYGLEEKYGDYNREDYLIIGDSLKSDIGFGQICGIDSCWFNKDNSEISGDYTPTYVIKDLLELKNII